MRVLVTGASGLLGGRLAQLLAARVDVAAARYQREIPSGLASVELDVENAASVARAIDSVRPDAVLHSAALANAETCEREPERARRINVDGTGALVKECAARGIRLVAISTDLVFPGDKSWSSDTEPTRPLMTYGRLKREGEEAVLRSNGRTAIARVALILGRGFGPRGSATEGIAWALRAGRPVDLFTDEYRTPVDAESVTPALLTLLEGRHRGVFHLGGPERLSRYELGQRVAKALGLSEEGLHPVRQSERPMLAARPADVSLDSSRAAKELGYRPRPLIDAIRGGRRGPGDEEPPKEA
jgi:dTDP-4-dehydrorhamnose reductase